MEDTTRREGERKRELRKSIETQRERVIIGAAGFA